MDELKLSDDVIKQIDHRYWKMTEVQECYVQYEWIEYDKFEDVEYLAKGGFGTTFKAVWKDGPWKTKYINDPWERKGETKVALKCLHNSQDIATDFLKEVESNILVYSSGWTVRCYGITKDPKTSNFIMVMGLKKGGLRQYLNNNFVSLNWKQKLFSLQGLAYGLREIHDRGLIHHDFHSEPKNVDNDDLEYLDKIN
ncbi:kinase-like domain-containing protein [Rhizophagus irregularis DAOM 181602=DAOM 197198]|nr:kinase-like domain-containing protein [Rhizophagus irregularis DAOM 181602=DAOM 197198]